MYAIMHEAVFFAWTLTYIGQIDHEQILLINTYHIHKLLAAV